MAFGRHGHHLVAQAGVQCQVFLHPDIVLHVGADERLPHSTVCWQRQGGPLKRCRLVDEKLRQGIEAERSVDIPSRDLVVLHSFHFHSELQGMPSSGKNGVVTTLE